MLDQTPPPPPNVSQDANQPDYKTLKKQAKAARPWFKKKRYIAGGGLAAIIAISVASGGGADDPDTALDGEQTSETTAQPSDEPATETTAQPSNEPATIGVDYDLISTQSQELTELQFDDWAKEHIGTDIGWFGQVESVDESLFDEGYEVVVDVKGGSGILERARLLVDKDAALAVPKDADIYFTGTITELDNTFSLNLKISDVTIEIR